MVPAHGSQLDYRKANKLLDASVTQSALEEALASRMQDGTIGSRMSTIGHAIRSRYLPVNRPRDTEHQ
jgi:hypothetical protein